MEMAGTTVESGRGGADLASEEIQNLTDWCLDEHREILEMVGTLERTMEASSGPGAGYLENVASQLQALAKTLEHHFAHEDSSDLYTTFLERFPRFSTALARLGREHTDVLNEIRALASGFASKPATKNLRKLHCRVEAFIATLRRHEAEENEILQRAYCEDIGGNE
jgi:iron-sulfur cluster repair protein YtfE (RIC family)